MAYLRVATALVEERSAASKSATSSSSRHSRSDLIDLHTANFPPSRKKSTSTTPTSLGRMTRKTATSAPTSTRTGVATTLATISSSAIASVRSGSCRAYSPGTHARKDEEGLLLGLLPCNRLGTRPLYYIKEDGVPSRAPDLISNQHQAQGIILDPPNRT
jgi:hypothetical protein